MRLTYPVVNLTPHYNSVGESLSSKLEGYLFGFMVHHSYRLDLARILSAAELEERSFCDPYAFDP